MSGGDGTPPPLGTQDLHAHTTMSDGRLPLERVVALARERGVQIGIADHVSTRNARMFIADEAEMRAYLDALDEAPVFRAAEFCWCDTLWADLPAEVMGRLDYRLGSNHGFHLPGGGIGSPWWERLPDPWGAEPDRLMEVMVANLCDMVRAMPIEIAAHSTLLPPALYALEADVHAGGRSRGRNGTWRRWRRAASRWRFPTATGCRTTASCARRWRRGSVSR
jgi:histidinol phosphatase-like PHP family hydrolase